MSSSSSSSSESSTSGSSSDSSSSLSNSSSSSLSSSAHSLSFIGPLLKSPKLLDSSMDDKQNERAGHQKTKEESSASTSDESSEDKDRNEMSNFGKSTVVKHMIASDKADESSESEEESSESSDDEDDAPINNNNKFRHDDDAKCVGLNANDEALDELINEADDDVETVLGSEADALRVNPYPKPDPKLADDYNYKCREPAIVKESRRLIYKTWPLLEGAFSKCIVPLYCVHLFHN